MLQKELLCTDLSDVLLDEDADLANEPPTLVQSIAPDLGQPDSIDYVDTTIATKYGPFRIRVYRDSPHKETVVLWTQSLDTSSNVLVRVHSECMTGDVFGSYQCDCGKQLSKALKTISEEGGVLIYLRQEGRGIGLFEKIKAYKLQSEGYDTHEANVLLGHKPDARSYEMVAKVLSDLKISHIRLLTNNPSKVSEIAKLGIVVTARLPLIVKSNKHNRAYFDTKHNKFHHFKSESTNCYFYRFPVENASQVNEIAQCISEDIKDPLLRIGIGISASKSTLADPDERARINEILDTCSCFSFLVPSLHYSFRNSRAVIKEIESIKALLPQVARVQLNDLPSPKLAYYKKARKLFCVDIPLSDAELHMVRNKEFQRLLRKGEGFVLLDNSRGRGIMESKASLQKKIDTLLSLGVNDIALAGGYGPDELNTYFDLRRYYKINFSIDAETKLKTAGNVDIAKVLRYLHQLVRFDDPNEQAISQTREFMQKNQRKEWEEAVIDGTRFLIHPKVFHAGRFPSSAWYAKKVQELVAHDRQFCEVGCGSGVTSCLVALANPKIHVTATDINPFATENTQINVNNLGLDDQVVVVNGDVLDGLPSGKTFDSIFWAMPFGFLDPGTDTSLEELQVFDPGYRAIRKFFRTAQNYLKPGGKLLIGFSSDLGHPQLLQSLAHEFNIQLAPLSSCQLDEEKPVNFELLNGIYATEDVAEPRRWNNIDRHSIHSLAFSKLASR